MRPSTGITCGHCGREQAETRRLCELCGTPLARAVTDDVDRPGAGALMRQNDAPATGSSAPSSLPAEFRALRPPKRANESLAEPALYLGIGIPLAFVFSLTPILGFMGWFLAALFHEVGHSALAWFTGHPSVPAISLAGEAVAVHGEPMWFLRLVMVASIITLSVQFLDGGKRIAALSSLAIGYPLLIFTGLGEVMFLAAGHLGELAVAALCLWRAADGEACHHRAERAAYAMLGWFLCGDNILLSFGLAFSESARMEYASNGSFGLTNDYLRLANDHLGVSVGAVGFAMGLIALAVPIATLVLYARSR